jgi:heparinase II/III-like protein
MRLHILLRNFEIGKLGNWEIAFGRKILTIVILFFPFLAFSQITPRNLLQKKYPPSQLKQLLISQSKFHPFPKSSGEWRNILSDSVIQYLIKNGEAAMKIDFPNIPATTTLDFVRNGNRTRYENISFQKRNLLFNLTLAEAVEGKKRFLDAIVNAIWSIAEESFWGTSAHLFIQGYGKGLPDVEKPVVDLFAAEAAASLALADYFIGSDLDSISPLIRKRIYFEVNRRIFIPMQTAKYDWMGKGDKNAKLNNWAPWIMSNYLTAVLFLEKDEKKRMDYVSKAMQITDQYINGIGDDGASEEGPHYWSFGAGCVFDVLNLLNLASNNQINIYNEKIIRKMGTYIFGIHIAENYFVNVADSHPEENPGSVLVWRYGKAIPDSSLQAFGAWLYRRENFRNTINQSFHRSRTLFDLINLKNISSDKLPFVENNRSYFDDIQLFTHRLSNGLFISAHGGNNGESHNHNDVGDFIVYANGDPVIIDVGSGTYTARTFSSQRYKLWFNTSEYHNLPTINGVQQHEGLRYSAGSFTHWDDIRGAHNTFDIEKAYPISIDLTKWRREIVISNVIQLIDSFILSGLATSLTQTFMTVCETDITQPGKIIFTTQYGYKVELKYGTEWEISKEIIPLVTEEDQGLKTTWHNQPITRILLTLRSPKNSGSFQYIISKF